MNKVIIRAPNSMMKVATFDFANHSVLIVCFVYHVEWASKKNQPFHTLTHLHVLWGLLCKILKLHQFQILSSFLVIIYFTNQVKFIFTPFIGFSVTYSIFEAYARPFHFRSTNSSLVSPHNTWRSSALTNIYLGKSVVNNVMRCMPMLHNGLQVD